MIDTTTAIELLLIAVLVAVITDYIKLPYTVALVLGGLVVGLSTFFEGIYLSQDLILLIFLPPLLFEGSINMDLEELQKRGLIVSILALAGTFLSALAIGYILHVVLRTPFMVALLIGAMVTPTDPVSVLATFKELGVSRGLATIVEGESVFNDGIGVVLYLILLDILRGQEVTIVEGLQSFTFAVVGGAVIGLVLGYLAYRLLGHIDDHLVEVMVSLILAYGVFLLAERIHASGVIAVVVAGLIIGNYGRAFSMTPTTRITLTSFWEVASFIVNSLLFLLIGLQIDRARLLDHMTYITVTIVATVIVRAISVYGLSGFVGLLGYKLPRSWQHVINWGGLKGSIPLALALGLPAGLELRDSIVSTVFGVVAFSLLAQGLTIRPLLERLGLVERTEIAAQYERELGRSISIRAALEELESLHDSGEISEVLYEDLREGLEAQRGEVRQRLSDYFGQHDVIRRSQSLTAQRRILSAQRSAIGDAFRRGLLSEHTFRDLRRDIDARFDQLR